MKEIINTFKALSDETRLRILHLLIERECCVCEVVQSLGISQTRASRNLKILHDAGFLKSRRDGLWVVYSIDKENMGKFSLVLTEAVRKALKSNKLVAHDREQLKGARRVGPGCVIELRK